MVFTINEIRDIIVMTLVVGFIFKDIVGRFDARMPEDYLTMGGFDWKGLKFAAIATAPAIIAHELGHKFVAMAFGMVATFKAAYLWLGLGVIMKLIGGFIFLVPAYVRWGCPAGDIVCAQALAASPWIGALIAFAGPGVNLLFWRGAKYMIDAHKVERKYLPLAVLTMNINKFLFFFNMIPIPGFDGFHVFGRLIATFF